LDNFAIKLKEDKFDEKMSISRSMNSKKKTATIEVWCQVGAWTSMKLCRLELGAGLNTNRGQEGGDRISYLHFLPELRAKI
jgi:hypothetical protein